MSMNSTATLAAVGARGAPVETLGDRILGVLAEWTDGRFNPWTEGETSG